MNTWLLYLLPLIASAFIVHITWNLTPRRLNSFWLWMVLSAMVIVGLTLPLVVTVSSTGGLGTFSLYGGIFLCSLAAVFFTTTILRDVLRCIPEHISRFRLRQIVGSLVMSGVCALFIWLSLPALSFASATTIVVSSFSASYTALALRNAMHEERLYLMHLIKLAIGENKLTDEQLGFIHNALGALKLHLLNPLDSEKTVGHSEAATQVTLTVSPDKPQLKPISLEDLPPRGWIHGTLTLRDILAQETSHLYAALHSLPSSDTKTIGQNFKANWSFAEHSQNLDEHKALNRERHGYEFVSASPELKGAVFALTQHAKVQEPLVIIGDKGVGKSTLAKAILSRSHGMNVVVFDVKNPAEADALLNNVQELIEQTDSPIGIIIEHVEHLRSENWNELTSLLAQHPDSRAIAVLGTNFPSEETGTLRAKAVHISPIKNRHEDLFFLAVEFLQEGSRLYSRPIEKLSIAVINELFSYDWPGNCDELRSACLYAVQHASGGTIESLLNLRIAENA